MGNCFPKKQNCCIVICLASITITPNRENTIMELALFSDNSLAFLLRFAHLLAGVAWIGLLYYFNFIQGEYFKEADGGAKSDVIQKMVPNALWWFRWGAMFTFVSGILLVYIKHLSGMGIMIGVTMGTIMFLNVWLIIWPNQKIVIASAKQVAGGGEALPGAAAARSRRSGDRGRSPPSPPSSTCATVTWFIRRWRRELRSTTCSRSRSSRHCDTPTT